MNIHYIQLLGNIDIDTREWTDGVLTYASRQVVKEPIGNVFIYIYIYIVSFHIFK